MDEKINQMPKVELHLHLDGAVPIETAIKLSGKPKKEVEKLMVAPDKCLSLADYLKRFDFPISLMQTEENLTEIAKAVADNLAKQNVMYAEIRFAPMFHTRKKLSYEQIVNAVLNGFKHNTNIKTNLILCLMRGMSEEENIRTLKCAQKFLGNGVCAIDLAGNEAKYPVEQYAQCFRKAKELGIPYTIHSGEVRSVTIHSGEVSSAIEVEKAINLGARRIGHGIHSIGYEGVLQLIQSNDVLLEVCPTSNVQTNAVPDYYSHPIKRLLDRGIKLSINTDNSTVSNVSLTEEYEKLQRVFGFTVSDFEKMNRYALAKAFVSNEERRKLISEFNGKMKAFNNKEKDKDER